MRPEVLILGQITVDDVVPSTPGVWSRRVGGNALYAAAGARLWSDNVGVVARLSETFPLDVRGLMREVGLSDAGLRTVQTEPMVEWLLYESDGQRQSMPRNFPLRDPAAGAQELARRYSAHMESISASASDIPAEWMDARAVHLAPQVEARHQESCRMLRGRFLAVDPSPHYARGRSASQLWKTLEGASAFLPSRAEVQHLLESSTAEQVVEELSRAGFSEVALKLGAQGCVWMDKLAVRQPAAPAVPVDLTGAGDSFGGAYAACRVRGLSPGESVVRAVVAASLVVETSGAEAALRIDRRRAVERLGSL